MNKGYGQSLTDLPNIEDFEKDISWIWSPWENREGEHPAPLKVTQAAHSGKFGLLFTKSNFIVRRDIKIGLHGEVISFWIRFQGKTRANCGFGMQFNDDEYGYYLCVDPSTNTLHFAKSPDYTYALMKVVSQEYKLNTWYRIEIVFNTQTNVTGKLYASNGTKLLNSLTIEIQDLKPGGIAFRCHALHIDDIRGGRHMQSVYTDSILPLYKPIVFENIEFGVKKSSLLPSSFKELDELAAYLKRNPSYNIKIVGFTDDIGKEEDNIQLSIARAKAVADYLVKLGVNSSKISYKGLGSSNSIAKNTTEEGRRKNRRVEITLSIK